MAIPSGRSLGVAMCEALGIDHQRCYSISIDVDVSDVGRVTVGMYAGEEMLPVLEHYELKPITADEMG